MMNPTNIMTMFMNFRQNPMGFFAQNRINIPQGMVNNPDAIIQQMMNSGQINQQTYNQAQQMARQMRNNPAFRGMFR